MSEIAAAVDRVLDRHASKHVGVAVGVRAETELHTCGRGRVVADRPESPSANTIFEIGSITKVFTAVLLADLVQRGLVALEDPVQRYLPEGVRLPVRGQPVTLADLATHSAGFPGIPKGMLRRALTERANPWATFAEADLVAAVPRTRLRAAPGRRVRYSNYGFGLLGYVLARVAGTSYEALVQERICRPLELVDTSTVVPDEKRERLAHAHDRRGRPVSYWDIPGLPGAGALHSTVDDLLAFLDLNLFLGCVRRSCRWSQRHPLAICGRSS